MESNTLLNEDPFRNENTQRLFEAIDELRSCGANHDVGLPELVIVGDQSAGKSSLLQSLTDIPFPVADRLCTRFPTRIVSRRTPNESEITKISIEPSPDDWAGAFGWDNDGAGAFGSEGGGLFGSNKKLDDRAKRQEAYRNFAYNSPNITADGFKDAIDQAKSLMDIKRLASTEGGTRTVGVRNFASDVLKVEISGPDRSYFSILDVPGVFQSLTKGLTDQEKNGVKSLVASYMKPKHSIIICVASGTNDLANQAAFDMASKHDPQLQRTIGVVTKCDITQHKESIVSLAQNEEKYLNHGWFVVRNRTPAELASNISISERHNREKAFFDLEPWNRLPEARRGTQALKRFLADLLCERIQETFPSVLTTIRNRQAVTRDRLDTAGLPRDTTEDKRTYLTDLAQQLYSLTSQALRGRYDGLSNESLKLRRFVREANHAYAAKMIEHGHSVPFDNSSKRPHEAQEIRKAAVSRGFASSATHNGAAFGTPNPSLPTPPGGSFGSEAGQAQVGPQVPSTKGHKFDAPAREEYRGQIDRYQTICTTYPYRDFSFEELRLSDYLQAKPSLFAKESSGTFSFGRTETPFGANIDSRSERTPASPFAAAFPNSTMNNGLFNSDSQSTRIYTWIREEIKNCRGTELQGTLNPDVLPALFHRQIAKWKEMATSHFQSVAKITTKAIEEAAYATCGTWRDKVTAQRQIGQIRQTNKVSEDRGISQIHQRCNEIVIRHLQTQNPTFEMKIRRARLARFEAALQRYQTRKSSSIFSSKADANAQKPDAQNQVIVDLRDVASLFDELHFSNEQNLEDDIHDTLKSYYELALHDFIEFMLQQVVESYLDDPRGPVLFFNPTYISSLTAEEIDYLGAEDADTVKIRKEQQAILTRLNRAEEIALKYS